MDLPKCEECEQFSYVDGCGKGFLTGRTQAPKKCIDDEHFSKKEELKTSEKYQTQSFDFS